MCRLQRLPGKSAVHPSKEDGQKSLEDRVKRLNVSKYFIQQRKAMEKKISTAEGILLRVNRSIQAEGVFAAIIACKNKETAHFLRGK